MTKPGFRKGRPTGAPGAAGGGGSSDAFVSGALFSQAQILQLMKNEFARARRHTIALACLLLQVDRLAQLVDLYGAGLRQVARSNVADMVRDRTRGADLLGTTSDDRYLLLLPHTELDEARLVADRLVRRFGELEIAVDGRPLALSMSVGIAASADGETLFFDTLVAQAEAALDFATRRGGNQIVTFGETQLRSALEGGGGDVADRRPEATDPRPGGDA